jgi:flagellar biosynthesis protein FlhG
MERLVLGLRSTLALTDSAVGGTASGPGVADVLGLSRLGAYRRLLGLARKREAGEKPAARVVCVASGKGGTGKSIISSNLAVLRAKRGERVLLVDFDAGLANAHLLLGLAPQYDLSHVLQGQVSAEEALVEGPAGVWLLSGGVGRHVLANPTRRELDRLFRALLPLEELFDLIVIDHGAGLSYATVTHLAAATVLLLVTNHEVTALSDGYALYKRARLVNPTIRVGLVVNRVQDEPRALSAWERFQNASQRFLGHAPEFVGWVAADPAVARSVELRVPVALLDPESPAARAIDALSRWEPIDQARGAHAFFERARAALR